MKKLKALIIMAVTIFAFQAWADTDAANKKIYERIKPVGTVCAGSACGGADAAPAAASTARSGESVYNSACVACHGSGLLNAPKKGDAAAWDARFAQGEATVLKHAIEGLNAMPPKGTCGNCSDDDLMAAINYMSGR